MLLSRYPPGHHPIAERGMEGGRGEGRGDSLRNVASD